MSLTFPTNSGLVKASCYLTGNFLFFVFIGTYKVSPSKWRLRCDEKWWCDRW